MSIDHITLKFTISEEAKASDVARTKRGGREHAPKVPNFPPLIKAMAQKLGEIIDAGNEQSPLAYAALTRLCVLMTPNTVPTDKKVMIDDMIRLSKQAPLFQGPR